MKEPVRFHPLIRGQKAQRHSRCLPPDGVHSRKPGHRLSGHSVKPDDLQPAPILSNPDGERGQTVDLSAREREFLAVGKQLADNSLAVLRGCGLSPSRGLSLRPDGQEDYQGCQRGPKHVGVHVNVPPWD